MAAYKACLWLVSPSDFLISASPLVPLPRQWDTYSSRNLFLEGVAVGVGETSEEDMRKVYELEATLREKQARLEELEKDNKSLKEQLAKLSSSADAEFF